MSKKLKKYIVSRLGDSYVLLQDHPSGKKVCLIKKKDGAIDPQFKATVQQQVAGSNVSLSHSKSSLRLEADTEEHFNFLFDC